LRTVTTIVELRDTIKAARISGRLVAFVPTMGALHKGHASLIRRARAEGCYVVASIFVNPLQFNDPADLASYPRTDQADEEMCRAAGVDLLWKPSVADLYPDGFDTAVAPGRLGDVLEGAQRPGHFAGMATVVLKLFNSVTPDLAFFGQKDFQQLAIVRRMVRDFDLPIEIVGCPTVRESDGLAMSSRNVKLTREGRAVAAGLSRAIGEAAAMMRSGEAADRARQHALDALASLAGVDVEYLEVVDGDSLEVVHGADTINAVVVIAARVDGVRLIDNVTVKGTHEGPR
jgi:pantoate--beta-alanine ligase